MQTKKMAKNDSKLTKIWAWGNLGPKWGIFQRKKNFQQKLNNPREIMTKNYHLLFSDVISLIIRDLRVFTWAY